MRLELGSKEYMAQVLEVHSGDDMIAMVDLGFDGLYKKARLRLRSVDTPDAYRSDPSSDAGKLRDHVRSLIAGKETKIVVHSARKNGWIVTLTLHDKKGDCPPVNLNEYLVGQGYVYDAEAPSA